MLLYCRYGHAGRALWSIWESAQKLRRGTQRAAAEEMERMRKNILANRPKWMPLFLWVRIVRIVLDPGRGQSGK